MNEDTKTYGPDVLRRLAEDDEDAFDLNKKEKDVLGRALEKSLEQGSRWPSVAITPIALLPCPFCGGRAVSIFGSFKSVESATVHCVRCYVSMPARGLDHNRAVEAWNSRCHDG